MNVFEKMIEYHKQLLADRGYDEISLNNGNKPGTLSKQLVQGFLKSLFEATRTNKTNSFFLETTGKFNYETDTLHFNLFYVYNPKTVQLNLKAFGASMDEKIESVFLEKSESLPSSTDVYNVVKKGKLLKEAAQIKQPDSIGKRKKL